MEREFYVDELRRHRVVVPNMPEDDDEWEAYKDTLIETDSWREFSVEDQFEEAREA